MISEKEAIGLLKKHIPDEDLCQRVIHHCTLVKDIAMRIAQDIPNIDLELVRNGALLHDIGRFGCPPRTEKAPLHGIKGAAITTAFSYLLLALSHELYFRLKVKKLLSEID